jgi:hypothetical protein
MNSGCTNCNDKLATTSRTCYRCNNDFIDQKTFIERAFSCPEHKSSAGAICAIGHPLPPICNDCTTQGYYLERHGTSYDSPIEIHQKSNK